MSDYKKIPTSAEVAAVIRARHGAELQVFSSFSNPDGRFMGGPGELGVMETGYGIRGTDFPLLWYRTEWQITPTGRRGDETHSYWLCIGKADQ